MIIQTLLCLSLLFGVFGVSLCQEDISDASIAIAMNKANVNYTPNPTIPPQTRRECVFPVSLPIVEKGECVDFFACRVKELVHYTDQCEQTNKIKQPCSVWTTLNIWNSGEQVTLGKNKLKFCRSKEYLSLFFRMVPLPIL